MNAELNLVALGLLDRHVAPLFHQADDLLLVPEHRVPGGEVHGMHEAVVGVALKFEEGGEVGLEQLVVSPGARVAFLVLGEALCVEAPGNGPRVFLDGVQLRLGQRVPDRPDPREVVPVLVGDLERLHAVGELLHLQVPVGVMSDDVDDPLLLGALKHSLGEHGAHTHEEDLAGLDVIFIPVRGEERQVEILPDAALAPRPEHQDRVLGQVPGL